jgi:predicted Zn-dependent peptidase
VIEENIQDNSDYENNMVDNLENMIYFGSNYQYPVDSLEYHKDGSYRYQDVLEYYHTYYHPSNFIVSIVSNVAFKTLVKYLQKTDLAKEPPKAAATSAISACPGMYTQPTPQTDIQYKIQNIPKNDATYIGISFRTCSQQDPDRHILNLLKRILGGYFSSRMFLILREDNGLTYSSSVTTQYFENTGDFTITAVTDNDRIIKNGKSGDLGVLPLIIKMLNDLIQHGVTTSELVLAKEYNKGMYMLNQDDIEQIAVHNGIQRLLYPQDNSIVPYRKIYQTYYEPITKADIERIIQKYLRKTNMNVCIFGYNLPKTEVIKRECSRIVH